MRHPDVIIREAYEKNQQTFDDNDRLAALRAWDIYMSEVNEGLLRNEFECAPRDVNKLLQRPQKHRNKIDRLRIQTKRFEEFIELIESLGDRRAVTLNPLWWSAEDAPETIERILDPQSIPVYRAFHTTLVAYLDELSAENPDWHKLGELISEVAYTVEPNKWQKTDTPAKRCGLAEFGTRWFLEAILIEPEKSVN